MASLSAITPVAVVITGAPRSGTYWVVDLLQTRLGVCIPSETHFYPLFQPFLWLWGDLSLAHNRRRLLGNIYEFIQAWTARSARSDAYRSEIRRLSLLVTLDEGRSERIVAESSDYASLAQALYRHFADIHGADCSGDKSAHHRAVAPERLLGDFPQAKMLHVIRDGRDVALSWMREWFGPISIADAAYKWREHVEVNRAWGRRNPDRYLELRYEDLADNLDGELARLGNFLGRAPAPTATDGDRSALARALSRAPSHTGMADLVAADNLAKWRRDMTAADLRTFEAIAGAALRDCGYALAGDVQPGAPAWPRRLSLHALRLAAKRCLPLLLGVAGRLHLPVLPLLNRQFPREWRSVALARAGQAQS